MVALPVIHPGPADTLPLRWIKAALREVLHLPVRLALALDQERPWLAGGSVAWLDGYLRPDMRVFEWGSGRSTVYLARRCGKVVSVEHHPKWRRKVARRIRHLGLGNVEQHFVPPGAPALPAVRPDIWQTVTEQKPEFAAYADRILWWPAESFDMVLVDGRNRVACAANAASRIRPGGALVLDNSEWPKYSAVFDILAGWSVRHFSNGVWRTTVFVRPQP